MKAQWDCLLNNLGTWEGSFTQFSPQGELLKDTPSLLTLAGRDRNQNVRLTLRRFPPNEPVNEIVQEYSSLSRSLLFFDNGAFSQGTIQLAPYADSGAELALIHAQRRLRLVQQFNSQGQLKTITLIREKLADSTATASAPVTVNDLLGNWQGEAVTIYPDLRNPDTYTTALQIERIDDSHIQQQLSANNFSLTSTGTIQGSVIQFQGKTTPTQVVLLPGGATSTCPPVVKLGQAFFLEVGWLVQPGLRQRMIRSYNEKGEWTALTLVTEKRI